MLSTLPSPSHKRYRVGIDVGLHSIGFAAIEIDEHDMPISILNAMSLIHDAGLDPDSQKTAQTRRMVSGVARRTRRLYRQRKRRLKELDEFLLQNGYPVPDLDSSPEKIGWKARAALAEAKITDTDELKLALSHAARHIARHRGWRNPYTSVKSMMSETSSHSDGYAAIEKKFREIVGLKENQETPETLALMVMGLPQGTIKLRGEDGLFSERLQQKDFVQELLLIGRTQELEKTFLNDLIEKVFYAKSPKGSAEGRVGKDELDPSQYKAWRATRAFQEYRIISLLANIRIQERNGTSLGEKRPLSVAERQKAFHFLNTWTKQNFPTWADVSELLGIDRGDLRGTASSNDDGERVTSAPPINNVEQTMSNTSIKEFKTFWKSANNASKDALIRELSNVEAPSEDSPEAIAASSLIRSMPPESLEKLESLHLPDGRSAYSEKTLQRLSTYMLNNVADLHAARRAEFGVDDDWAPAAAPIGQPTGNPAVDRVLKATNRWLMMAEHRWGTPVSINVESMRDGFKSEKSAREISRGQENRAKRNKDVIQSMMTTLNIEGRPDRHTVMKYQAIQRQNGQCAYCGSTITMQNAELDHIVPRAGVGSTNSRINLLAACANCNRSKGKLPFAVWAKKTDKTGVSVESAIDRVKQWPTDAGLNTREMNDFKQQVIFRLKRVSEDEEIDARSKESVSWMANELRHRVSHHFGSEVTVRVFRGSVTAAARRASGVEDKIRLIGGRSGKNRLDRRHHAIDAAVIALMQATVAQILTERDSLRSEQKLTKRPDTTYGDWREYTGKTIADKTVFKTWLKRMNVLVPQLQIALDEDRIPVSENLRLRLGNGQAHKETIQPLNTVTLGSAISMDQIDRAFSPALWTALTRCPDFDWKEGLPENLERQIQVNGTHYSAQDEIKLFSKKAGALALNGGFVELGSSFHHARLYRITGGKKDVYAMLRVYTVDLARYKNQDLFQVELPPQTISVRQAEPKLRKALREGKAEYLTWFVVDDELMLDTAKIATEKVITLLDKFGDIRRWRIRGFESATQLCLRPAQLSAEGLSKDALPDLKEIIGSPDGGKTHGWRSAINKIFGEADPVIIRRDVHGRVRVSSSRGLPVTYRMK
ncbi:type II CRISPR RNA-guided endonuclease Cas9 [Corynebacterium sp. sy039]|uniref:type II CRISPR RNA-guided endonuclease Cas9 n=1 Tax=Corynebacterium sp. sy039 TaxID=2599641 RepID=UPI0011B5289B|nr:type II CRISPR RNA-guided endonuclease Cas9 [Corynebacterium sp. sy039]QDZ41912.1 CRISPR-associated protein [Corynebacterium sp. sy039]